MQISHIFRRTFLFPSLTIHFLCVTHTQLLGFHRLLRCSNRRFHLTDCALETFVKGTVWSINEKNQRPKISCYCTFKSINRWKSPHLYHLAQSSSLQILSPECLILNNAPALLKDELFRFWRVQNWTMVPAFWTLLSSI